MAYRSAVANGNWSSTSTWNGGILPVAGDIVASNGFTVTIDQNVNVDSITNTAQSIVTATAAMTGYSTPTGYLVEASNYQEPAWQAFDRNGSSRGWVQNLPLWISYTFPSTTIINSYRLDMYTAAAYVMQNFTFEGWNGSSWVVLHTVTGNSLSTYISPSIGNTTAYIKYRFYCTATPGTAGVIYQEIALYELGYESAAVQGGTFNLNSGVTVTCTGASGITAGINTCLTYSGTGTSTINANINALTVSPASYTYALVFNGIGILNINGNLIPNGACSNKGCLLFNSSGTLNVVGIVSGGFCNSPNVLINGSGNFNLVGNVSGGSNLPAIQFGGTVVATITGNLFGGGNSGRALQISESANVSITGNLQATAEGPALLTSSGTPLINIIGNLGGVTQNSPNGIAINASSGAYIKVIGTIYAGNLNYNFLSTSASAINILTGPFISHPTGIQPIYVARMHYFRTMGSYFEFRDNSTNGALPPAGSAPATRLVSPDTVADSPIPANVRQGVTYALGSQTGTMIVPDPANVVKNVPVDNTVGTGVLDPSAMWNVPLAYINTSNSIGKRVKNAATVESTGAQIQTTLNNNP